MEKPLTPTTHDPGTPRAWTYDTLAQRYGCAATWWRRRLPELIGAGLANKIGVRIFARPRDVECYLLGVSGCQLSAGPRAIGDDEGGGL